MHTSFNRRDVLTIYLFLNTDHFEEDLVPFTSMMIYWGSLLTLPFQMVHDHLHFASSTPTTKLLHYLSDIDVIKRLKQDHVGKGVLVPASDLQQQKVRV